jgi:sarcosine oxidase delta subunit
MKFYSVEESEKWLRYGPMHGSGLNYFIFDPFSPEGKSLLMATIVSDVARKCFYHSEERIKRAILQMVTNYPQFFRIYRNLKIYMCPRPSATIENATCFYPDRLIFWARSTQIPTFMTDYIVGHEIGHVVQDAFCNTRKHEVKWREYLELRKAPKGICKVYVRWDEEKKESIYEDREDFFCINGDYHTQRPRDWDEKPDEWFAEDFRYLFGVDKGEPFWGLPVPPPDEEIKQFFLSLG